MTGFLIVAVALLAAGIALAVGIFFLQSYMFPEPSLMQERLQMLKIKAKAESGDYSLLDPEARGARLLKGSQFSNQRMGEILQKYSFTAGLQKSLRQAGMKAPVDKFVMTFLVMPSGLGVVMMLLLKNIFVLLLGPALFMGAVMLVQMKQKKRLTKLSTQLPDALNLITSSLRAGHSFQSALKTVVEELPDPISTEFGQVVSDLNWRIPVRDALYKMVASLDSIADIRMFVTSLVIQRETGGNLAEILDKLSYTIRERFKLQGQVKALTGQARLTGYCLGAAPVLLFVFMYFFMNKYITPLITTDLGKILMVVGGILQAVGFFIMKKIVEIRV